MIAASRAAGIDVGAETHYVAVPPSDDVQPVRRFGADTVDLEALADWMAACGITTGALESTGVYWIPLFELLEARGFEVLLVEPQPVQRQREQPGDMRAARNLGVADSVDGGHKATLLSRR